MHYKQVHRFQVGTNNCKMTTFDMYSISKHYAHTYRFTARIEKDY